MADPPGSTWSGHPRGVVLVAFTELWERFSYWGMAGILVLYLTASREAGGWGWADADALRLYGWYGGAAFVLPVFGAWLTNNHLGEQRCVLWGGSIIVAGHLLLASPVWFAPPLGHALFLLGLGCIAFGTGLLKPAISSLVSLLYPHADARRDEGFALFFLAIYIGAFLGAIVVGFLGERVGWHAGFAAAAAGMGLALLMYVALKPRWLGELGRAPARVSAVGNAALTRQERERLGVLAVQGAFTALYAAGFYQMFGLLNLYAHERLDRHVWGFEVPTPWLQTVSLCGFFICTPLLAALWRRLARDTRNPSASWKLVAGLGALAAGYGVLTCGENSAGAAVPHVTWMICAYLLFGLGDAFVWANQISLVSKLAPARWSATLVGAWYVCIGIGTWLTGVIGAQAQGHAPGRVFAWLACGCLAAALLLALCTPALRRAMHGHERLDVAT